MKFHRALLIILASVPLCCGQEISRTPEGQIGVEFQTQADTCYEVREYHSALEQPARRSYVKGAGNSSGVLLANDPEIRSKAFYVVESSPTPSTALTEDQFQTLIGNGRTIQGLHFFSNPGGKLWRGPGGSVGSWSYKINGLSTALVTLQHRFNVGLTPVRTEFEIDFSAGFDLTNLSVQAREFDDDNLRETSEQIWNLPVDQDIPDSILTGEFFVGKSIGWSDERKQYEFFSTGRFTRGGFDPGNWRVERFGEQGVKLIFTYDTSDNDLTQYREEVSFGLDEGFELSLFFAIFRNDVEAFREREQTDNFRLPFYRTPSLQPSEMIPRIDGWIHQGIYFSVNGENLRWEFLGASGNWEYRKPTPFSERIVLYFDSVGNEQGRDNRRDELGLSFPSFSPESITLTPNLDSFSTDVVRSFRDGDRFGQFRPGSFTFNLSFDRNSKAPDILFLEEVLNEVEFLGRTIFVPPGGGPLSFTGDGEAGVIGILPANQTNMDSVTIFYLHDSDSGVLDRERVDFAFDQTARITYTWSRQIGEEVVEERVGEFIYQYE